MRELKKYNEEELLFFDIETASVVPELEVDSPLYNSWDYKVNKDGEMSTIEVQQSYRDQAGLHPEFAKIISIVVGKIEGGKIVLKTFDAPLEKDLLNNFNNLVTRSHKRTLVGFVNIGFDSPFIFKRMLINGIEPHGKIDHSGLKPWEISELDLAILWKGSSFNRASLINVANVFGLPSPKDDISGKDVGRVYWEEGVDRISKYCRKDVITTINVFRKMCLREPLKLSNTHPAEPTKTSLVLSLFGGAKYGVKEKKKVEALLGNMTKEEFDKAIVILKALSSTAKGKITKIKTAHIKELSNKK